MRLLERPRALADLPGRAGLPDDVGPLGGPPSRAVLLGELTVGVQLPRFLLRAPWLLRAPRGDGQAVVDVPGWLTGEVTVAPLRAYLRLLGWDARPWGLGTMRGDPRTNGSRLADVVRRVADETGRPVHLVGWSLGGTTAREAMRQAPDEVASVISFGSPLRGGPVHTVAASRYAPDERRRVLDEITRTERARTLDGPLTHVWTRRDGVVRWEACLDRRTPQARHVEVGSTHLGLGVDPDVWQVVAHSLAAPGPTRAEALASAAARPSS